MRKAPILMILLILSVSLPFLWTVTENEVALGRFSNQLDTVEGFLGPDGITIPNESMIYVSGNTEACTFRAKRIYQLGADTHDSKALVEELRGLSFLPARERADDGLADFYYSISGNQLSVMIQDGPYSPGFDIRCW